MHTTHTAQDKPTAAQLRYLKDLALTRGESFVMPATKREASAEINRLKARKPTPAADVRRERREIQADMATGRGDNAQVRDDEITGFGSNATWKRDPVTVASAVNANPPHTAAHGKTGTNPPVELARYNTSADGERIVYAQRVNGSVRLTDKPAGASGRSFLIERGLHDKTELDAILADYLAQAGEHDTIPVLLNAVGRHAAA